MGWLLSNPCLLQCTVWCSILHESTAWWVLRMRFLSNWGRVCAGKGGSNSGKGRSRELFQGQKLKSHPGGCTAFAWSMKENEVACRNLKVIKGYETKQTLDFYLRAIRSHLNTPGNTKTRANLQLYIPQWGTVWRNQKLLAAEELGKGWLQFPTEKLTPQMALGWEGETDSRAMTWNHQNNFLTT